MDVLSFENAGEKRPLESGRERCGAMMWSEGLSQPNLFLAEYLWC